MLAKYLQSEYIISLSTKLAIALGIIVIGYIFSKYLIKNLQKALNQKEFDPVISSFILTLIRVILLLIAIIFALNQLGINLSSIIAVLSAAGLAIALSLQNSLSNLAAGILILMHRPFKKGDYIMVNNHEGNINKLGLFYTKIITADNKITYIPNNLLSSNPLVNFSTLSERRADIQINLAYNNKFTDIQAILQSIIIATPHLSKKAHKQPLIVVSNMTDTNYTILLRYWVNNEDYLTTYFYLLTQIKAAFEKEGVSHYINPITPTLNKNLK